MAAIVLVHSALGLDSAIKDLAKRLTQDGHYVVTPDLFGGETFTNLEDGVARADAGDMDQYQTQVRDALRAAAGKRRGALVLMGFSLGAVAAQIVAMTEPGVRGLVLVDGAISPEWFGGPAWPEGLRAQLHVVTGDHWVEAQEIAALEESAPPGALATFTYEGEGHLVSLPTAPAHDPEVEAIVRARVEAFLGSV